MQARDEFAVVAEGFQDVVADARHDVHVDHDVGRIGDFHADLRDRGADRAHAERDHVHRAAPHAAGVQAGHGLLQFDRIDPVVGRAGFDLGFRRDVGAVLDPRHVARMAAEQVAVRALPERRGRAGRDHLFEQGIVFGLRAVAPADGVGLAEGGDFIDPLQQRLVFRLHVVTFPWNFGVRHGFPEDGGIYPLIPDSASGKRARLAIGRPICFPAGAFARKVVT